ncbi:beta-ketoacyl synthase N-terminal-like domain-containing protein [Streptomyces sp. ISL-12]|uniref:beta-ketoacyl synthase N-terminal-like domain-containing protein n=1 Tax=Streptomyces sp. ISL-12 TaxID=2819177 RepID=UPI0020365197|nr:beta-ketoacyl synthase N-terminal-like domain-containing protein [Streptomyces sp. ISL-12]
MCPPPSSPSPSARRPPATDAEPVAIVGRGCVLPGALDPETFWAGVVAGRSALSALPDGRWDLPPSRVLGAPGAPDRIWTDTGGYVHGFDEAFDPTGFELAPADITPLDRALRWVLHAGRQALREAGADRPAPARTGLVLGNLAYPTTAMARFAEHVWLSGQDLPGLPDGPRPDPRNRFGGGLPAHLAARALGLGAGGYALDAACASSLYALKTGCDRLRDGSADLMLAGAVAAADNLFVHQGFCALTAMSRSGRSRPFHRDADGLVPAEGAALFALARLRDAVARGMPVLGVIRGIGLSNDGAGGGLLAPDRAGQERAVRAAYAMAGVAPESVSLVECHAPGTPGGDLAEALVLREVFTDAADVPIGSVKSNLGHPLTAAGGAGLLKVLGALGAGVRPPTLHADAPLDVFAGTPLRLLREAEEWPGPRRAAVSAFGFGGANAHLVVDAWEPGRVASVPAPGPVPPRPDGRVAIVAVGARAGSGTGYRDLCHAVLAGVPDTGPRSSVEVAASGLRFPPADLAETLPQQVLALEAAREAAAATRLPSDRTMVLLGMGPDPEAARCLSRWRAPGWTTRSGGPAPTPEWPDAVRAPVVPATVSGTMPNLVAHRINVQLGLRGPGHVVCAEEASGLVALELGARALRTGEADAVLAGAVDLSHEPVHRAALRALGDQRPGGDVAVVLVLKRLADAERDGDRVLALLAEDGDLETPVDLLVGDGPDTPAPGSPAPVPRYDHGDLFGVAHAAHGALAVAVAAIAVRHQAVPRPGAAALPADAPLTARARVTVLGAPPVSVLLRPAGPPAPWSPVAPRSYVFSGADRAEVLAALAAGRQSGAGPARLVVVVDRVAESLPERLAQARRWLADGGPRPDRIAYRDAPVGGETAFVFPSGQAGYPGCGAELRLALRGPGTGADASPAGPPARPPRPAGADGLVPVMARIRATTELAALHGEVTRGLLGLRPDAAIGFSSGESTALLVLGVWSDAAGMYEEVSASEVFRAELAGEFRAAHRFWRRHGVEEGTWAEYLVHAVPAEVRAALAGEPLAHLLAVDTPDTCVIGGLEAACRRVLARIGPGLALSDGYRMVAHAPEAAEAAAGFRALHRRPVGPPPGLRFYSAATGRPYPVDDPDGVADALLTQLTGTVDYPKVIERAWADGVRVFVEHGPGALRTRSVRQILAGRDHVAVALDAPGGSLARLCDAVAELTAAGVCPDPAPLFDRLTAAAYLPPAPGTSVAVPAHPPAIRLPEPGAPERQVMRPAPSLPAGPADGDGPAPAHPGTAAPSAPPPALPAGPLDGGPPPAHPGTAGNLAGPRGTALPGTPLPTGPADGDSPAPAHPGTAAPSAPPPALPAGPLDGGPPPAHPGTAGNLDGTRSTALPGTAVTSVAPWAALAAAQHARLAAAQQDYLERQSRSHAEFLRTRRLVTGAVPARGTAPAPSRPPLAPASAPGQQPHQLALPFDRATLEYLAHGRISDVFGPAFRAQDGRHRQTRLPRPPMLLVDRVTRLDAEPGSMSTGTVHTETDVTPRAWYLDPAGRMPAGLFIEAGQADLLLISRLGVDLLDHGDHGDHGDRVYRLLGCEVTYHGPPPAAGETLRYEIHVEGHAEQEGVRLFFFRNDCYVGDELRLSVREGQAGFFTDGELARSDGVRWSPGAPPEGTVDPPALAPAAASFGPEAVRAFAAGRPAACFGPGWDATRAHVRTPATGEGRLRLLDEVTELDPAGGPWGRGYLRAERAVRPDDWFFDGHFHHDPCMPGTLMFEGCLQAMAFYLTALGFTVDRDGWRFEPVPGEPYRMRCRGQVTPRSRRIRYEVFVGALDAGPRPTLRADVLCTVDGLPAFHVAGMGLRLVPDWPLEHWRQLGPPAVQSTGDPAPLPALGGLRGAGPDPRAVTVAGAALDHSRMLAAAWGRPSTAFGVRGVPYDDGRRCARLPGPPYLFVTRVVEAGLEPDRPEPGSWLLAEYDVPEQVWYFEQNGAPVMPFAVLNEVVLQPCGMAASLLVPKPADAPELLFRNLQGTGTVLREVPAGTRALRTRVELRSLSEFDGVTLVSFDVGCEAVDGDGGRAPVMELSTVFGYFPAAAFDRQPGLPPSDAERARLAAPCDRVVELRDRSGRYGRGSLRLPGPMLLMLDRITGYWPGAGAAGLGRLRAERAVDAGDWYFRAHFFTDPVQPGSLGLEGVVQLLQWYLVERDAGAGMTDPRFESVAVGQEVRWLYRGQVVPADGLVAFEAEITAYGTDARGRYVRAEAWLWVDGRRVYHLPGIGVRVVDGDPAVRELTLDPAVDTWLDDHRPNHAVPAVPMMTTVDQLATAASRLTGRPVTALREVRLHRWLALPGPVRIRTDARPAPDGGTEVRLSVRQEDGRRSRYDTIAEATASTGDPGPPPQPLPPVADGAPQPDPYQSGELFHGPALRCLTSLSIGPTGASAVLDAGLVAAPFGALGQGLLDGFLHAVPSQSLWRWIPGLTRDMVGYPHRLPWLDLYAPLPAQGEVRVEARFAGFDQGQRLMPVIDAQVQVAGRVVARLRLVEILVRLPGIDRVSLPDRRAFATGLHYVATAGLSTTHDGVTTLALDTVRRFDFLPGSTTRIYRLPPGLPLPERTARIAVKEHVSRLAEIHPQQIEVAAGPDPDRTATAPGGIWHVQVERRADTVVVRHVDD